MIPNLGIEYANDISYLKDFNEIIFFLERAKTIDAEEDVRKVHHEESESGGDVQVKKTVNQVKI